MDLRRVKHFVVLAETLNFRRAAERLHMSQPPLTVSIQKFETELGTRLFDRGNNGVTLTPAGRAVLAEARKILFHGGQISEMARSAVDGTGGTLKVGFVGTSTWGVLQKIVPLFRAQYPGVELILHEATSINIVREVEDRVLDVGIVRTPLLASTDVTLTTLERHDFMVALPRGHALSTKGSLHLKELAAESFLMYAPVSAAGLHSAAMLACQHAGFVPRISQQGVQVQTLLALVESGLGVALVPSLMQRYQSERVIYRPLVDLPPSAATTLALAHIAGSESAATARFLEMAIRSYGGQ